MADNYLPYKNPASTDAKLDTESLTVGANTVHRERIQIAGAADTDIAPVDGTAGLKVNLGADNDVTITSGTVAATQSGTWTVQPGNTANTTAWKVDGSAVTQPVSGTVTANAGTNLNTSALALESGGNLASIVTSVQLIDDIVYTDDTSTHSTGSSKGALIMAAATPTDGSVNANDIGAVAMTTDRKLHVSVQDALPAGTNAIGKLSANSGVDIGDVDVTTVGTITPGTAATSLGKAEDAAHASGDVGVMALAVANEANTQFAADADYVPIGTNREGSIRAIGSRAHDAVDADGPVKVGHVAIAHGTNPTAVAAADRTNWYANRAGIPFVMGGHPNIVTIEAAYTAAQTDTAIVTISTGLKIVVTQIQFTCDNANTVDVGFRVGFGTANTPTTTGVVLTHPGVAAGSGVSRGDGSGIIGVGADNEDLRITCEAPTTGSCRILASYYTIET